MVALWLKGTNGHLPSGCMLVNTRANFLSKRYLHFGNYFQISSLKLLTINFLLIYADWWLEHGLKYREKYVVHMNELIIKYNPNRLPIGLWLLANTCDFCQFLYGSNEMGLWDSWGLMLVSHQILKCYHLLEKNQLNLSLSNCECNWFFWLW